MFNHSEKIGELAERLAQAQLLFQAAKFNSTNPFLKNKYADLGSVIEAARPALGKFGLCVLQPVTIENGSVTVETILAHASGEWISSTASMVIGESKGMSVAQAAGSIITYLRRYQFASLVGIYADEDTDGNKPESKAKDESKPAAEPAPVETPQMTTAAAGMDFEAACKTLNSKGVAYGEIPSDKLAHMLNSLVASLKGELSEADRPEHEYKRDAIIRILNERAKPKVDSAP
jgi:hypothetical protein